jgi:hypothetical protein
MTMSAERRFLVVVDHTLGGTALTSTVSTHAADGAQIHVLAPAEDQRSAEDANTRLQTELERLKAVGVEATGSVAMKAPLAAVRDAVAEDSYAGIVIATPPLGLSKLVGLDMPHRAQREFKMPVEWIEARTDDASERTTVNMKMPRSSTRYL